MIRRRVSCVWALGLVAVLPTALPAQPFPIRPQLELAPGVQLAEVSNTARSQLEQADAFLADGQWDEAIEALQAVLDAAGNTVIPAPGQTGDEPRPFLRYVGFRHYCQLRIAALAGAAPRALEVYRNRVDPLAERWYRQGCKQRQADRWRDVVRLYFASSYGDDALLKLGEWHLERGHFTAARLAWQRIAPALLPAGADTVLVYPDTDLDLAEVRARLVLVSILEGASERAAAELQTLNEIAPDAVGVLAGRRGTYGKLLEDLLRRSRSWPPSPEPPGWTTFGGTPRREKTPANTIDVALRPLWSVPLPRRTADDVLDANTFRAAEQHDSLLSYHPLIVEDRVLVAMGQRLQDVRAFDLQTGRALWPEIDAGPRGDNERAEGAGQLGRARDLPALGVPRFTMTAHADALYVKLGPQITSQPPSNRLLPAPTGYLAALDLAAQKKRLFEIHLDRPPWGPGWAIEGPPVADDGHLYVLLRRRDNVRHQAHVACFDRKWGRLQWRQFVAAADTLGQGQYLETTHNLLSLDQGVLYCNTNLGAVAALRVEDGQILWVVRYPRRPASKEQPYVSLRHVYRDITPCLVHCDRVFAAPADSDRIFALDALTGRLEWATDPQIAVDVVHLLGVGQGNLVASGSRLYWIDARSGHVIGRFPSRVEDDLRGHGRGLLAGNWVYWPTAAQIHIFRQDGPQRPRQPIDLVPQGIRGGNLAVSGNVLLVAGGDRLTAFPARRDRVTRR